MLVHMFIVSYVHMCYCFICVIVSLFVHMCIVVNIINMLSIAITMVIIIIIIDIYMIIVSGYYCLWPWARSSTGHTAKRHEMVDLGGGRPAV